jgi:hypothetical protein
VNAVTLRELEDEINEALAGPLEGFDLTDALAQVREIVKESVRANFYEAHAPDGAPWPKRQEPDRPYPHRPLILTGGLLASALRAVDAGGLTGGEFHFDESLLEPYGVYHVKGTRHLPRRDFWGVDDTAAAQVARVIEEAVEKHFA